MSHAFSPHDGPSTCSRVQDLRWRDSRWLTMEFDPIVQHNPDDMTRNISLRALSELLQKLCLDDKIALFSEYAQNNDLETIDAGDVFKQLYCNSDTQRK